MYRIHPLDVCNRHNEGLHGKRDTLERDIFIGGLFSFSPIVIFVV
jgi:hypothetical protein